MGMYGLTYSLNYYEKNHTSQEGIISCFTISNEDHKTDWQEDNTTLFIC